MFKEGREVFFKDNSDKLVRKEMSFYAREDTLSGKNLILNRIYDVRKKYPISYEF